MCSIRLFVRLLSAITFFPRLQLLADLFSLTSSPIPRFCIYTLPSHFHGSAQLTLSLNNIKIMSNKSDTAKERMDGVLCSSSSSRVAFYIGIIWSLFVFVSRFCCCLRCRCYLKSAARKFICTFPWLCLYFLF